jgi:hypothetical protein
MMLILVNLAVIPLNTFQFDLVGLPDNVFVKIPTSFPDEYPRIDVKGVRKWR